MWYYCNVLSQQRMFREKPSSWLSRVSHTFKHYRTTQNASMCTYAQLDAQQRESFFRYENGRYLYNEKEELAARYIRFNIEALQDVAISAMGAQSCVKFTKLAEGAYNRVFYLEFDNGSECVARLPYPLVGPSYLVTASEVATLDFLSTVLGVSVPRVYAWSSHKQENNVEADFIIMEKMKGVPLSQRWNQVKPLEYVALAEAVHDLEKKLAGIRFSQIGSIYFREDVSPELQTRPLLADYHENISESQAEKYRIGPIAERTWWRGPRCEVHADRGPWSDAKTYVLAAAKCEGAVIKDDKLRSKISFRHPLIPSDTTKHLDALDLYQKILLRVIPTNPEFLYPTLWHPDFYQQNILVSESGPVTIHGFIDWQFATTEPYYVQANFPPAFAYLGERIDRTASKIPALPSDFETASEDEKIAVKEELKFARWHTYYEGRFIFKDERRLAMHDHPCRLRMLMLPIHALRCWSDGYFLLREYLLDLIDGWETFVPNTLLPVDLSDTLRKEIRYDALRWMVHEEAMEKLFDNIGLDIESDGRIVKESFEKLSERLQKIKFEDLPIEITVGGEFFREEKMTWPFGDGGISHYLS